MKILFLHKEDWEKEYVDEKLAPNEVYFYKSFEEVPKHILDSI
jgi:hypothetical protein